MNSRIVCLAALLGLGPGRVAAQSASRTPWRAFRAETLGIAFRHPPTPGLRLESRAATCAPSDRVWAGGAPDSMLVVTRTVAPLEQIASYLGMARQDGRWLASGYQDTRAPVAVLSSGGWHALVADSAVTVVYDLALRAPVAARQWRLVAIGPADDGCHPLLVALATGLAGAWDSTTVSAVLATAQPRAP